MFTLLMAISANHASIHGDLLKKLLSRYSTDFSAVPTVISITVSTR